MCKLLTREKFKKLTFDKTNGKCCVPGCSCEAIDAHHILDRKLWKDGGYYINNGAALCSKHHRYAESGVITPMQCFEYMNIDPNTTYEPDKLKEYLNEDEYHMLLIEGKLNKWGE